MTPVLESEVVRAIRGFKAQLRAQEGAQTRLLATKYLDIETALEDSIVALSEQIARLTEEGLEPTWSAIYRLERYQRLQAQLMAELASFNGWAADLIKERQLELIVQGIDNATAALEVSKPGMGAMVQMPHDAVRGIVGVARDGSPLGDLLAKSYPEARQAITRELIRSVALGRNPRVTAQAIRKATNVGLDRALTIARTEQLRAYREASRETYQSMGCQFWQRLGGRDERSCLACIMADGEIRPISEPLDDHPDGLCDMLPIIPDVANPVIDTGRQWFERQPESTQLSIMGPGRFDAWKSGTPLSEMTTTTHDPVWGNAPALTPVSALTAAAAA